MRAGQRQRRPLSLYCVTVLVGRARRGQGGRGIDGGGALSGRAAPSCQRRSREYVVFTSAPAGSVERGGSGGKVVVVGRCRSNSKYA